ncbi:MAG: N-acetylmuramoyl-L-alanine amidase, partial [Acidimicrobiales bacterium]
MIVVHTAEGGTDFSGPDPKAENVANFIRTRSNPGSYHLLGDSDSIIQLVRFENEAFQDGTGSNRWAIGISVSMNAADWPNISASRRTEFTTSAAQMAAIAANWLDERGLPVPAARLLTKSESDRADASGFISHARRDPTRRSDPGAGFPWSDFFRSYQQILSDGGVEPTQEELIKQIQTLVGTT